jgi:hypothetical protein
MSGVSRLYSVADIFAVAVADLPDDIAVWS